MLKKEPVLMGLIARGLMVLLTKYGLDLTLTEVVAILMGVDAVISLYTRQAVTPNEKVEQKVEQAKVDAVFEERVEVDERADAASARKK